MTRNAPTAAAGRARACAVLAALVVVAHAGAARSETPPLPPSASPDTRLFSPSEEARARPRKPTITYWTVTVSMDVEPTAEPVSVRMLAPVSDGRQAILGRTVRPSAFRFREDAEPPNLWVGWEAGAVKPQKGTIAYTYTARTTDAWFEVPRIALADNPPSPDPATARPSGTMQSDDPAIVRRAAALTRDAARVDEMVWSIYQYAASLLRSETGDAPDDAVSVLNAERGSPSGRARLLAALLRAVGIPARLVGGLRLEDAARKRATVSWVEAWLGGKWVPFDPGSGHYATLPATYLALYYGDLPLIEHTAKLGFKYDMLIHQVTRQALLAQEAEPATTTINRVRETNLETDRVKTHAFYAEKPVASVVIITDAPVAAEVIERIVAEARERSISVVFLSASFESRYFREHSLQRLIASNFDAVAEAHLLLVSTRDEAGLYALLQLGEHRVALRDARLVIAGGFPRSVGRVLGSVLYRLVGPGELVLVSPQAPLGSLWGMARANLIDGTPMVEAASAWDLRPQVIDADDVRALVGFRRGLVRAWSAAVLAQVPLQAINLILVLPVIACIVVIFRSVVGIETFGTFAPVIVSLAFLMTGLTWGIAIFCVIVGLGVVLRSALQWFRIQLVARLAVLIALVSMMMAGLTVAGAYLGVGALLNVSIFPMVIMSNVIENFTTTQVELGTREAVRLTRNTLLVCAACYLTIEWGGLQSIVLSFPEVLILVVALEVAIGKWRGLRLLEYFRFSDLGRRAASDS